MPNWRVCHGPYGLAVLDCNEAGECQHVLSFLWEGDWQVAWLMAAAPELLAACEAIVADQENRLTTEHVRMAKEAIAKAKLPPSNIRTTTVAKFSHHAKKLGAVTAKPADARGRDGSG